MFAFTTYGCLDCLSTSNTTSRCPQRPVHAVRPAVRRRTRVLVRTAGLGSEPEFRQENRGVPSRGQPGGVLKLEIGRIDDPFAPVLLLLAAPAVTKAIPAMSDWGILVLSLLLLLWTWARTHVSRR
ncbi:IPTL-CTERM sorting domain-containing protein [Acidovorax sp. PRC11]|uniref:IPTL-CTERM sorting domain-containing protein n=1 Tax=Acidovorax sp. PRC11 TaxID=2962592 RepID=UPI003857C688